MYKICGVIVTFNPDNSLLTGVNAALKACSELIVVDNGSINEIVLSQIAQVEKIHIIKNQINLGIATALNQGVSWALENGFDWILTLDQDTIINDDMVPAMLAAYQIAADKENIAILAPVHYDKKTGYQSKYLQRLRGPYNSTDIVMTSGNLIPRNTFLKVGFYDDDLFIEYVDHDFCLRIRKAKLKILLVPNAKMAHELGDVKQHRFGPLFFFSHNYAPSRRYYRARNRLVLYRRHFGLSWILHDQEFAIKDLFKIFLVERNRWKKVVATIMGTIDGILGRMGNCDGAIYTTPKASKYFIEFREEILHLLPEYSSRALDLGCGSGETSGHLKKIGRFGWVCGVEGSDKAAEIAENKLDQVLKGDIEKMDFPFPENSFDTILLLDILEHLVDPWTVIEKLKRLLKPGGIMIASIPNVRHYSVVLPLLFFGDWRYQQEGLLDSTHIRFFTSTTALKLMSSDSLDLITIDHTGAKKGLGRIANLVSLGLFKQFFIFQNLIKVQKKM